MGKTAVYQGVKFSVKSVKTDKSYKSRQSPDGRTFLLLDLDMKNSGQVNMFYMFPNEELSLMAGKETVTVEDYHIDNGIESGQSGVCSVVFLIPEAAKKMKLNFRSKKGNTASMDIKL
jgi:hypothetical protein